MLRKLWLPFVAVGVWWLATSPAAPAPELHSDITHCGVVLVDRKAELRQDAMPKGRCGEMLDGLMSDPNWSPGVTIAGHDISFGEDRVETVAIHSDATVVYTSDGRTRAFLLDPGEQAAIRELGRAHCVTPTTRDRNGLWTAPGASTIHADALGRSLQRILGLAVQRRHAERLTELAPISLDVRAGKYRIELFGETVRVHHGGRVVAERKLRAKHLVDLVDHVAARRPGDPGPTDEVAHGRLTAGGVTYPIQFGVRPRGVFQPLWFILEDAMYDD